MNSATYRPFTPPPLGETSPNSFVCHQISFNSSRCSGTPPSHNRHSTPRCSASNGGGMETPRYRDSCVGGGGAADRSFATDFTNGAPTSNTGNNQGYGGGFGRGVTPMQTLQQFGGTQSAMCTPQLSRHEVDLRAAVDREVSEVNCAWRRTFPPLVTQLEEKIFIGGLPCEETAGILHSYGVTHIINVSEGRSPFHAEFDTHTIVTRDDPDVYILDDYLDEFCDAMDRALADPGSRVYVHCVAGVNRSVTLMIGYMMQRGNYQLLDAIRHFRKCGRYVILDNMGFRQQLVAMALADGNGF